ncbi:hypothetical protein F4827_004462 [Paraburkholderia bannensis]|uniref:Uncharacterized protein n=1 Tax=Paraburkholderia bannensis TaxID=765414 RepID=A0A7W9U072_9BURK|nr:MULTISPECIES: hypothetical protein [Paraburkholderia]MBB3259587.1 hypothetical protein [Paraburkholderia sp. WP4_3_2]MBB6104603.1 hypothetical protein [Paraburkholderia bannensis]
MKRRSFLKSLGVAATPLVRFTPPLVAPERIALYDRDLAKGRTLAHYARRAGMPAWSLRDAAADDIGMLWHVQLAAFPARTDAPTVALCALRASDRFVLERLAGPRGFIVIDDKNISVPD